MHLALEPAQIALREELREYFGALVTPEIRAGLSAATGEFGEAGVARFFATTDGWDTPILDDRAAPLYPRHQLLTPAERALTDHHLATLNARLIA